MKVTLAKLGILVAIATALLVFAIMRPGVQTPVSQADLGSPGGISALPSAAPGVPGVLDQQIPAILPARGDGSNALVTVFCDPNGTLPTAPESTPVPTVAPNTATPTATATATGTPPALRPCADDPADSPNGAITFTMTQLSGDGSLAATFDATGTSTLVCRDGAACDLAGGYLNAPGLPDGVVSVLVKGGGENEMIQVTATDGAGEARTVQLVVVDTIYAWGPTGAISTASQQEPVFISYNCPSVGQRSLDALEQMSDTDGDGKAGLNDIFNLLYGPSGMNLSLIQNKLGPGGAPGTFIDLLQCGGDTSGTAASSLFDDFVDFQTDKGLFSVDPMGVKIKESILDLLLAFGINTPPSLDFNCGEGKNVDTFDVNSLAVWGALTFNQWEGGCDVDFAGNGVVTSVLLGNGQVGVATITAQQGGGASPVRTINVTFVGEASAALFLSVNVPTLVGTTGADFTATVVDQDGRPVGGETVECLVDPTGGALAILNQTGTTGSVTSDHPGAVTFKLVPTGASVVAGAKLTVTCTLDSDRSVSATADATLSTTPNLQSVALVEGCNPVAATWPDATAIATVSGAVAPTEALTAIWKFDPASGIWKGFSPTAPADVSDLATIDRLDAIFVCVNAAATFSRPVI